MKAEIIAGASILLTTFTGLLNISSTNINTQIKYITDSDTVEVCSFRETVDSLRAKNDNQIIVLKSNLSKSNKEVKEKLKEINKLRYDFQEEEYPIQLSKK